MPTPTAPGDTPIELRLTRRFAAPVDRVWRAWTDPEALMRWFGPAGTRQVLVADTDVRVGGTYQVGFVTEDGQSHYASGEYREVRPLRRLVFTWAWRDTPEEGSLITLEFAPSQGGTELAFLQTPFVDQATRDSHENGWAGAMDRLADHLASAA
ncbi:SRPBCC domain-containing protein [Achromobacter sp. Bel]|uniref:SRPBCC family protein n=1 Tax=Achromobacter sp. Bel TaxID=2727415 RepID=UPI00145D4A7B|nr:SRPBCC domain-containing protein [Achromobacter sp. Bel]NMK48852.1 SRPBCC domain-containing protein [Achromobacter sp. Bel]